MQRASSERVADCLLGTAVGDALGLPREGLARARAARMFGGPLRHRLVLGRGMLSDDTAHAEMTLAAYARCGGDVDRFSKLLAAELRQWFLTVPPGMGLATLRSCLKLCVGVPPSRSGVSSAGNGPAMRAPILGVLIDDPKEVDRFVVASTRLTHTHPMALEGARIVATLAHVGSRQGLANIDSVFALLRELDLGSEWGERFSIAERVLADGHETPRYLASVGLEKGVSGYMLHTVLATIYCCLRHRGELRPALEDAILAGGDSDTLGAIVGGICGASTGVAALEPEWITHIADWPGPERLEKLALRVAAGQAVGSYWRRNPWPVMVLRNMLLLVIVLCHAGRRALPPY